MSAKIRWEFPITLLAACLAVFVLPFAFPPGPLEGLSAANVAGFNNRVASLATALISIGVLFTLLRSSSYAGSAQPASDLRSAIPSALTGAVSVSVLIAMTILGCLIVRSGFRYTNDAYYFIHQIDMHVTFGKKVYEEIEFPYGPLIFYAPVLLKSLLAPLHLSFDTIYFLTLALECSAGVLLCAFVISNLPITHRLKIFFFLLCSISAIPLNFGINGSFIRFFSPAALLILAFKFRERPLLLASILFAAELFCLSLSPEIGFAFFWASLLFALWQLLQRGRAWLPSIFAPILAAVLFFLLIGPGYLRMLQLFSKGYLNLIIEPFPHVLIFLFAIVWMVPRGLALYLKEKRPEASLLSAIYLLALAQLPAAFGSADGGHIFCQGVSAYALSMVSVSRMSRIAQRIWIAVFFFVVIITYIPSLRFMRSEYQTVIRKLFIGPHKLPEAEAVLAMVGRVSPAFLAKQYRAEQDDSVVNTPLDIVRLKAETNGATIFVPLEVPRSIEEQLRQSNQFAPSFYCFHTAILDKEAELRQITEMNSYQWALVPYQAEIETTLTPASNSAILRIKLPYPHRNPPYVIGRLFNANLVNNWEPQSRYGLFMLYKRRQSATSP